MTDNRSDSELSASKDMLFENLLYFVYELGKK